MKMLSQLGLILGFCIFVTGMSLSDFLLQTTLYSKNKFDTIHKWSYLDYAYPDIKSKREAILAKKFIPENNVPLGIDKSHDRLFLTIPRFKDGVPATLAWIPYPFKKMSPLLIPYPSWEEHADPYEPDCSKLVSVYRTTIDECGRLWVIDSGSVNSSAEIKQICPPKIVAYDLRTNCRIFSYEIPPTQVEDRSLLANIVVDVRNGTYGDAYAYVTDIWKYGIIVFNLHEKRSWRATHSLFYPEPSYCSYNMDGFRFQWVDGVFGMSLGPVNENNDRVLFFHPLCGSKEYAILTSTLQNEQLWLNELGPIDSIIKVGDRGYRGQSSASRIARNGVMFFTLVQRNGIGCWNTRNSYTKENLHIISENSTLISPAMDLKLDQDTDQGLWILSNNFHIFLYGSLDFSQVNFRVMRASVANAIMGSCCDPNVPWNYNVLPEDIDDY